MKKLIFLPVSILAIYLFTSCSSKSDMATMQERIDSLQTALNTYTAEQTLTKTRLTRFDSLDFEFYNGQKWDQLAISHDAGIQVYYPDGSMSLGLPTHIEMLKPMFTFAPDTKITNHRVKFGSGDWTAVVGEMQGTFTNAMSTTDGKIYQPTGKQFKLMMCTIAHWKDGKMTDEYLFWDNHDFLKQIGLAQ